MNLSDSDTELRQRLNGETSKIGWSELQRFYAKGQVIAAAPGADLIEVACCLALDDKNRLQQYLESKQVFRPDDDQALRWHHENSLVWAVVVAPWVLIQEVTDQA